MPWLNVVDAVRMCPEGMYKISSHSFMLVLPSYPDVVSTCICRVQYKQVDGKHQMLLVVVPACDCILVAFDALTGC